MQFNNNMEDQLDFFVGKRLKQRRTFIGMSQEELGDRVGVTFQQIQKYEKGSNRIGATRLFLISKAISVKINYFFDDFVPSFSNASSDQEPVEALHESANSLLYQNKDSARELATLIKAFKSVEDSNVRKKILSLVKSLSDMAV